MTRIVEINLTVIHAQWTKSIKKDLTYIWKVLLSVQKKKIEFWCLEFGESL